MGPFTGFLAVKNQIYQKWSEFAETWTECIPNCLEYTHVKILKSLLQTYASL